MDKPWLKFYDPGVPRNIDIPTVSFPKILDAAADEFPGRTALFFFGAKITYAALRDYANQFARALAGIGFQPGGRIGFILPNMPQAVIGFFGTLKAGGTAVFFDPLGEEEELERRVKDSAVEILVILDLVLPRVDPIFARTTVKHFIIAAVKEFLPFPRNVLFGLGAKARGIEVKIAKKGNVHPFKEFLQRGASGISADSDSLIRPEDPAVIQYAAGTGERSKGVLLTSMNLLANLKQISSWMVAPGRGEEGGLSLSPFFEAYGMVLGMHLPISLAGMSVQQPKFEEAQVLAAFKKSSPSLFPALSFMIQPLINHADLRGRSGGLKVTWSLGAPVPVEVAEKFERQAGGRICECYGVAEGSALTHANPLRGIRKPGSIGLPLPGTDARIVDPSGGDRELPVGEPGELIIRGPQVMKGYWNGPEETDKVLRGGWLYTGDQARMDKDGFFYILGKVKR
jgi:long-chain acyl-CoA synthetase